MTRVDIISGFLGAGKTTLIKKLISEEFTGEKLVLIENEFGEIGIDGGFMSQAGITVNEMNSGCICCSLVGDFEKALGQVVSQYAPDRIIIEPSGVGKLTDVRRAVDSVCGQQLQRGSCITVADATRCKMYIKNFGEFFIDQISAADTIILSRTGSIAPDTLSTAVALLREHNDSAAIVTTDWSKITGKQILSACAEMTLLPEPDHDHEHDHDHDHCDHEHGHCCCHDHEHHEHEHEHEHEHCDHDHDHEHCDHEHDHEHHHHHHADEVFESFGAHTVNGYTSEQLTAALDKLGDSEKYGAVLRAKGYVQGADGGDWLHFDYVPGEGEVRVGSAETIGSLCVIGSKLNHSALCELFGVSEAL